MTETVPVPTDSESKSKLPSQNSIFDNEPACTIPTGDETEPEDDMYAIYEHIGKLRGEFQKNLTSRHPWSPVLEELVSTEDQYLSDINSIITGYVPQFQKMETELPNTVTGSTTLSIFINLEEIRNFHNEFNQLLIPTLKHTSLTGVGQLFQDQADKFKIYSLYCANHSKSVELLVKLSKHKAVDMCLKSVQMKLQHPLNLSAYLLKPVQRVLKYKLLLESLLKHTKEDSEERALLRSGSERMDSIAKEINELTAVSEGKQLLEEIQEGLDHTPFEGCLTDYGNIHLKDNMLDLKAARSRQERLVLLLDKAMLICKVREKPKKGGTTGKNMRSKRSAPYKFKDFIKLTELTFTQDDHIRLDDKAFLVHKQTSRVMTTYCLQAKSLVKKNHWVSTLQDQVVASFNFAPDLLQQIMDTLKQSAQSLNAEGEISPTARQRPLTKYKHMISVSPSTKSMIQSNDSFNLEGDKRPCSMYSYSEVYSSAPSQRNGTSDEIYCETVDHGGEERDMLYEQVRKYSHNVEKKPRPRLPTPSQTGGRISRAKERDSGISDSREFSNAEVKQQMRNILCTMQQDYATFHDTKERDSGVEEGETHSQLDYLSLKRKHEGMVHSLVQSYMNAVSHHNQDSNPKPQYPRGRDSPQPGPFFDFAEIPKPQSPSTLLSPALPENSENPPKSARSIKPPVSPKPSLSPNLSTSNKKSLISGSNKKSQTLPRTSAASLHTGQPQEAKGKASLDSNTSPVSPSHQPLCPGAGASASKVSGMKSLWEKTIDAHKEECKK